MYTLLQNVIDRLQELAEIFDVDLMDDRALVEALEALEQGITSTIVDIPAEENKSIRPGI